MKISLNQVSKKFQSHWIFKEVSLTFESPIRYAILGANGIGKSTLLRIIGNIQAPSRGEVVFSVQDQNIEPNKLYPSISFCAPGMDIVEEMTLKEFLQFHFKFKKTIQELSIEDIIQHSGICHAADKLIGDFSSGMKQRVKLIQAIFSDTPILLLDEPCSNLDQKGVNQYKEWMEKYAQNRLVIVASNDVREYYFCTERIEIETYK